MPPTSPEQASVRPPHQLAVELIAVLGAAGARVIDFACGSGRNGRALRDAGVDVHEIADDSATAAAVRDADGDFSGAISTHGLLHGTVASIDAAVEAIAGKLAPAGRFYATFGSTRDPRFAQGTLVEPFVYAPVDGDERGVPHVFFDETRLRELLDKRFELESVEERDADHGVHWFVRARKRESTRVRTE